MPAIEIVLLVALLAGEPTQESPRLEPGDHKRTLTVGQRERSYLVHVPANYDPNKPTPVVVAFHGGGGNATKMIRFSGLNQKADQAGFLVVYPNGTGRLGFLTFHGGNCCGYAMKNDVDDVQFTQEVLDDLAKVANVDPKRVFATGMSNGAIMSYRVASELSNRIAAIAPVGGPMGMETCQPQHPVSVIHFHGTDDQFAPFAGGKGRAATEFYSVKHSIENWVKANKCQQEPVVTKLPDTTDDEMTSTRTTYSRGKEGAEVVLISTEGGGHTWPGGPSRAWFLGKCTRDFSANDLMWEFFQKHPKK